MKTFSDFYNNDLRADNSLNTKLDKSGFDYLKTKTDTQIGCLFLFGASEGNRTPNLLITNELLYH